MTKKIDEKVNNCSLWTAIVTPFNSDKEIDFESLENVIKIQEEAGNGILVLGSTGEALSLSLEEKKLVLNFVLNLKPKIPIMVGIGGIHLPSVLSWIKHLETLTIDSYLLVTPLYSKPGPEGQKEWFKTLLDSVSRPCMLYNVPGRTGKSLEVDAAKALEQHPYFWAIKEASGKIDDFEAFRKALPSIKIYSGDDLMLPSFSLMGAEGLVSVAANIWPKETKKYLELCLSGKGKQTWPVWREASLALFTASNPVPLKRIMQLKGVIKNPHTRPPLTHLELKSEAQLCNAHESVKQWFEKEN